MLFLFKKYEMFPCSKVYPFFITAISIFFSDLGAPSQVLAFSFVDTLLGLSGPAMCLCFTLVPQRTAKLTEGGDSAGAGGTGKWWGRSTP